MKNALVLALLCALSMFAVACGPGNASNTGNGATGGANGTTDAPAAADPFALYKNKGRYWVVKNTTKIAGMDDNISHMKTEVVEVAADHAMIKVWMLDKEMKPMAGVPEPTATKVDFKTPDAPAGNAPKVETKDETVEVKAGKFECTFTENAGNKIRTSKKYPGLMVKMEHASGGSELVEFKE